jgi:hypothetical protein
MQGAPGYLRLSRASASFATAATPRPLQQLADACPQLRVVGLAKPAQIVRLFERGDTTAQRIHERIDRALRCRTRSQNGISSLNAGGVFASPKTGRTKTASLSLP